MFGRNVGTFFTVIRSGNPRVTILIWSKERLGIRTKKVLLKTLQVKSRVYSEEMGTNILDKYLVTTEGSWSEWVVHFIVRALTTGRLTIVKSYQNPCTTTTKIRILIDGCLHLFTFFYILLLVLYYFEQIKVLRPAQIACFNGSSIIYCS